MFILKKKKKKKKSVPTETMYTFTKKKRELC